MKHWYVLNTRVNHEETACHHLQRQGYKVYLPRHLKRRSHARRVSWLPAPMFPRYLFVELDLGADPWRPVRSTVGVSQIVCHGEHPTPVPAGVVEEIMARENENGLVELDRDMVFQKGERVRILRGALADHIGIFDYSDEQHRIFVLLELMGREVKVRLQRNAVAANG